MISPLRSELTTIPFSVSALGNNIIVPYYDFPVPGIDVMHTFIHKLMLDPTVATDIVIKAVNTVTAAEREFVTLPSLVAGQSLIFENSTDGEVALYRLYKDEALVLSLSAAGEVKGFCNVSYIV